MGIIMKISRKCRHGGDDDDDVCFMAKVNKGAQKIMVAVPDQLAVVFMWSLFTGVFIVFLMTATCVILRIESPSFPSAALLTSRRERCPTASKHSLVARLDIDLRDVHYVFLDDDDDRIPQLSACSLESALNAGPGDGSGRVNVFVVGGIKRPLLNHNRTLSEVSMSSTLADLMATYGDARLNVSHVSLEECLECSPFQGMDLSGRQTLAKFVVQLVVLWQFGGTVLDSSVVVVRGGVYRATGDAVQYGDRTISSPVACHAFVYKVMLSAKRYALSGEPFTSDIGWKILNDSATDVDARPLADWVMCHVGVVADDRCYYAEAIAESHGYRCPVVVDEPSLPRIQETTHVSSTDAVEDDQKEHKRNTAADERVSTDIVI
ncbi:uncharacterized protein LOC111027193 isoform X2 [Myzus persicae]|uniref:uncharacterized protein LOC111027193 isoform X2 n=1 Tax=Myzus persicae TaxID=13164 RepID=UPI000B932577|nr:uncharacterized protein LOC111027193 isoform X2 [Myzus persicae]